MLGDYVVVDLEMTGLRARTDRILEIGAVKVENHQITDTYQCMVNPGIKVPKEIQELTGITDEMAAAGVSQQEAVEGFFDFCRELPLAGHNILFDYSFLKQYAVNHRLSFEKSGIDTLKLSRKFLPELEKKTLDYLCEYLGIERNRNHRALEDAKATHVLLEYLWENYGTKEPEAFCPIPLVYRAKKQSPATERQKRYLKELAEYHKIDLETDLDTLTKSEASRRTDKILAQYGKVPKPEKTKADIGKASRFI